VPRVIVVDTETRGTIDLRNVGVSRYARHKDTSILCLAWGWLDEDTKPRTWLPGEPIPLALAGHIAAGGMIAAWNIAFDLAIWGALLVPLGWPPLPIAQCHDIAAQAAASGLPRGLEKCAEALGLPQNKDKEGGLAMRALMRPAKWIDGVPVWRDDDIERLLALIEYCRRDVAVEREAMRRLPKLQEIDRPVWEEDQRINMRGMRVDPAFMAAAGSFYVHALGAAHEEAFRITGGAVRKISNSTATAEWLEAQGCRMAVSVGDDNEDADETPAPKSRKGQLTKAAVRALLEDPTLPPQARALLELRRDALRTSTAKLVALAAACEPADGRIRDTLVYHAASTGRAGGKLLQPQNLPRDSFDEATWRRALEGVKAVNAGRMAVTEFATEFGPPLSALVKMLRGAITAAPGCELVGGDFANIELRVNAWLAGQQDLLDALIGGADVYKDMAAEIYRVSRETVTFDQRQVGKSAALGCGFGLGWRKFVEFVQTLTGITLSEALAQTAVAAFRDKYDRIPALWRDLERAALLALNTPGERVPVADGRLEFYVTKGRAWLLLRLPSGRALRYCRPCVVVEDGPFGPREVLTYWGVNQLTRRWGQERCWGGVLCENAVQATARDLCMLAVQRVEARGWPVVLHIHDELIAEVKRGTVPPAVLQAEMERVPAWAAGLPIRAEAWAGDRYG
jgi:DNA polymerase